MTAVSVLGGPMFELKEGNSPPPPPPRRLFDPCKPLKTLSNARSSLSVFSPTAGKLGSPIWVPERFCSPGPEDPERQVQLEKCHKLAGWVREPRDIWPKLVSGFHPQSSFFFGELACTFGIAALVAKQLGFGLHPSGLETR